MDDTLLRAIPPVNVIAERLAAAVGEQLTGELIRARASAIQTSVRAAILSGKAEGPEPMVAEEVDRIAQRLSGPRLRPVINATGIVIHTNLGRAPVSQQTADSMRAAASGTVALEIESDTGQRGGRMDESSLFLNVLTGADRTLVVNNNAAAVLLVLTALANGQRVAVSRAESVEIGGGFRIPDVLEQSGATLVDVGTTNRTTAADYRRPLERGAKCVLRVHPSNFRVTGFVQSPSLQELRAVADATSSLLIEDLGSGTLVPTEQFGLDHEPTVQGSIAAGVDIVTFSGDKLLGGPQAGIICGRGELVRRIESHPLARAVRADKVTLAGVAETLRHYLRGDHASAIPIWRSIAAAPTSLRRRAQMVASSLPSGQIAVSVAQTVNYIGGGALPGQGLQGWGVMLQVPTSREATDLGRMLRLASPAPVFPRIEHNAVIVEMRTVDPADDDAVARALHRALSQQDDERT